MKTASLWIIRLALTVQFAGVLAVPALVAAAESPRAMWIAEWLNASTTSHSALSKSQTSRSEVGDASKGRTVGVLKLRDGKLSFIEQAGHADWSIDLPSVKRVVLSNNGRTMTVESISGESFVMSIMDQNLTQASPKRVIAMVEGARQSMSVSVR